MILLNNDCLEAMKNIESNSIDMILCDLPYGCTKNKWDSQISLPDLWTQYDRIIKNNGAVVLFSQGLFTSTVMTSQKCWRYNLVWNKILTSGFLNSKRMPLRVHEDICIFYKKLPTYNPQMSKGRKNNSMGNCILHKNNNYGKMALVDNSDKLGEMKYPKSILTFSSPPPSKRIHPTQKPVALLENLIRTYTNENELVLDNCMGSGSTGVACINTNRRFIGIEKEKKYFDIAKNRIEKHDAQLQLGF
jgi:site-specific DNA-methyltransferase (adenine-specific)